MTKRTSDTIQIMVGESNGKRTERLDRLGWGRCWVARMARSSKTSDAMTAVGSLGTSEFFDNGAFRWFTEGVSFQEDVFAARMQAAEDIGFQPAFAVVPDIVEGGMASLAYSVDWAAQVPGSGFELVNTWSWVLAVQDGMDATAVEELLESGVEREDGTVFHFSGLFLGGSDQFKLDTAAQWAEMAHRHGLRAHYGRAGSVKKLRHAWANDYDSADSALIMWTDAKFLRYAKAWAELTNASQETVSWLAAGAPMGASWFYLRKSRPANSPAPWWASQEVA